MGVQIGIPGPRIPVRDAAVTRPVTLTCRTPFLPCRVNNALAFDEAQRIPHSRLTSEFDLRSGVGVGLPV